MGYRFTCAPEDFMSLDTYFHNASIEQIVNYSTAGSGSSCPTVTATGNNAPVIDAGPSHTIPQNTPFTLTASGSDPDGDSLTFGWEQFDLGAAAPPDTDDGSRPIFRSFAPTASPSRTFPQLADILSGFPTFGESLPITTRAMNFKVTARDNRSGGGGVNSAATQVNVRADSGPFTVSQPASGTNWSTSSSQTVTWNVANTNLAPVNCASVQILLSIDGGNSFPIILASDTPNDGSQTVTIPGTPTAQGRIKVAANGNIFFNISQSFSINGASNSTPTISSFTPGSGNVGSSVTITGTNFISPTSVNFNGAAASFTVNSTTEIVATVPAGATTGLITVTTPSGVATSASNFTVTSPANAIQFSDTNYNVSEGGVSASVTVSRSGDTTGAATVNFATSDGTAVQSSDYTIASGTLSFAANETSKTFNVLVVDDALVEANETINLTLSNATGATLGAPTTATITIIDNDTVNATSPAAKRFAAALNGAQETPANASAAKGTGVVLLNQSETSAQVGLIFANLGSAETGAHIHTGAVGVAGPITFPLPTTNPVTNFAIAPNATQVSDLKAGSDYLNVHSNNFPGGEIRGQLRWNPSLEENFFVRQQYLDFLSRDGDPAGFNFWVSTISGCQADAQCFHDHTISTADAFFFEPEFQQTAGFVFRLYRAAYGNTQPFPNPDSSNATEANKLIDYAVFAADRARVVGGASLAAQQVAFANLFVGRPEFTNKYGAGLNTAALFVDAVLATIQTADVVDLTSQRTTLMNQYNSAGGGNAGRAQVMYLLSLDDAANNPINNQAFINAEYNRQFALTLYFGYLRRNPDIGGFLFWQSQINAAPVRDVPKQQALVCSYITSAEYQLRFGPTAPRTNAECPQ